MSYASDALIDAQRNTINRLKTENEKLRRAVERDADVMEALVSYINDLRVDRLCDENEKLRELVRYMWDVALHPQLFGDGSYLLSRMRGLGIEVEQ